MKDLHEIIMTVTQNGMSKRELFSQFSDPNTAQHKLVLGITDGTFQNDTEALETLFGDCTPENKRKYKQVKYNVRQKLLTLLLAMPDEEGAINNHRKARTHANKLVASGHILSANSATTAAEDVLNQAILIASRYELYDVVFHATLPLLEHYAIEGKKVKLKEIVERNSHALRMVQARLEAQTTFNTFAQIANTTTTPSDEHIEEARTATDILARLAEECPCFFTRNKFLLASMLLEMICNNYEEAKAVAHARLALLDEYPDFKTKTLVAATHRQLASCEYNIGDYTAALRMVEKAIVNLRGNTYNWSIAKLYELMICLRLEDMERCAAILRETASYIDLGESNNLWREKIWCLHGYYAFLIKATTRCEGKSYSTDCIAVANEFSLGDFLSTTPELSKDKKGMNITKNIIEILFLMLDNPEGAEARQASIHEYRRHHVRGKLLMRTKALLHMVELLIEHSGNLTMVERHGKDHLRILQPPKGKTYCKPECMEPIEYRRLWKIIGQIYPAKTG